jgi:hypothetical protein
MSTAKKRERERKNDRQLHVLIRSMQTPTNTFAFMEKEQLTATSTFCTESHFIILALLNAPENAKMKQTHQRKTTSRIVHYAELPHFSPTFLACSKLF